MKTKILFVILFSIVSISFCQETKGPKVITYSPFSARPMDTTVRKQNIIGNVVKFNYTLMVRGAFVFGYERELNRSFSVEGELGMTYRDYIFELRDIMTDVFETFESKTKTKGGVFISAKTKYYINDEFPYEWYVAPLLRFRSYNTYTEVKDYLSNSVTNRQLNYQMTEFGFLVGYQNDTWSDLMWETYFGPGFTKAKYDTYPNKADNDYTRVSKSISYPTFFWGCTIGFQF